jgi:hypothetical protein
MLSDGKFIEKMQATVQAAVASGLHELVSAGAAY